MNKQTFTIPEGCKAISMEIIDNAIVTTFEQHEFKKGDFVKFIHSKNIIILSKDVYDKKSEEGCFPYKSCFIKIRTDGSLDWDGGTDVIIAVTNEEKQFAIDALAKENKAWDAEKMEIVELKWKPKNGEKYWFFTEFIRNIECEICNNLGYFEQRYEVGNCFKTEAEAQKFKDYILKYEPEKNN